MRRSLGLTLMMGTGGQLGRPTETFHHNDLQADYVLEVVDGKLVMGSETDFEIVLEPIFEGYFTTDEGGALKFDLSGDEVPSRLTLDAGCGTGLVFNKKQSPAHY